MHQTERYPPRWLSFTRVLIGYIGYGLGGVVFVTLMLPLSLPFAVAPALRARILRLVLRFYCFLLTRAYLPALRLYRVAEVSGYEHSRTHQPAVYVANHRGRLDGLLLLGIISNTGVLMKLKYARQPVYSSFVKHLDFVSVDPYSLESLSQALARCKQLLQEGKNLLVFPEGTRASGGKLLPFKDFAFRIASDTGRALVPVAVHSDLPFMAKIRGSHFPKRTFTYRIRFLTPMFRENGETPGDFAERARQALARELGALDKETVWESVGSGGK